RYEFLIENSIDVIIVYDIEGNILDFNEIALKKVGYTKKEALNMTIFDFITKEEIPKASNALKQLIERGKTEKAFTYKVRKKDGMFFYLEFHGMGLKKEGKIYAVLSIGHDVTEEILSKKSQLSSEIKYQTIFHEAPFLIALADTNGILIDCNNAVNQFMSSHTKEDLLNKSYEEIFSENENEKYIIPLYKKYLDALLNGKRPKDIEYKIESSSGGFVWCHLHASLLKLEEEDYILLFIRDITEKKLAEIKIKNSEEKFRTISEQSLLGVCIIQDSRIKYINQQCADIFGYTRDEILLFKENQYLDLIHPDYRHLAQGQARKKKGGDNDLKSQYQIKAYKGSAQEIWVEIFSKTIKYKGNSADLIILTDITEKKKTEEKIRESEKRYREAYERENFYKDLFAHDMNNILQGILTSLDIFEMNFYKKNNVFQSETILKELRNQINRGSSLVENVRKFSKLDDSEKDLKNINVYEVIEQAISSIRESSRDREINIQLEKATEQTIIKADDFVIDVFENLLYNAIKHNYKNLVQITIKISEINTDARKRLKLEFIDNGRGIPDSKKKSIFERGFNQDKSVSGMGLGLSLVKRILNKYGAEIRVEDRITGKYQEGSNFIIIFSEVL
ncbi:MAG: PAS domain S-box protein, partial [Candidatus Lokiarchaeota archaeon]|nr:PAS domain S-box protein [Candidatus Lokiarchaeota archaeon]